jgi:hypothetical protein
MIKVYLDTSESQHFFCETESLTLLKLKSEGEFVLVDATVIPLSSYHGLLPVAHENLNLEG